jgi:type IV secretory pathway component VirB8
MSGVSISNVSVKIWMVLLILFLSVLILLVITISNTASRVRVLPQLFSPDIMRFNHFIETTNMQVPVKEKSLIEEMLVRFYVENRNNYIPNLYELSYRYGANGPVARLSSPAVFNAFQAQVGNFTENLEEKGSTTKTIDIFRLTRQDKVFTVDFDIYQFDGVKMSSGGSRRAILQIAETPLYRKFSTDFSNPYGLVVTSYRETPLKKR